MEVGHSEAPLVRDKQLVLQPTTARANMIAEARRQADKAIQV